MSTHVCVDIYGQTGGMIAAQRAHVIVYMCLWVLLECRTPKQAMPFVTRMATKTIIIIITKIKINISNEVRPVWPS